MRRERVLAFATGAAVVLVVIAIARRHRADDERCGPGFVASGARCVPVDCPAPLARAQGGCTAPAARIAIPATKLTLGPSDWEAQGRVTPRMLAVAPFAIDAFEITAPAEPTRAASRLTYDDAARLCASRGGRLPTEDEWIVAAAGDRGLRYPWGDTGAVCRRAAWGLASGPCATTGDGPDTVGAHPSGDTPRGVHDLAGNVAEWVAAPEGASVAVVRGGSWRTSLAADLRTWARRELPKSTRADDIGARCAYDVTTSVR